VARLIAGSCDVVAMVRDSADAPRVAAPGARIAIADLCDREALPAALAGVEIVCHCAAAVPGAAHPEELWASNVTGTGNLLEAAIAAGARRFVFVSTDSVYGDAGSSGATEDHPLDPVYFSEGDYPRSKLEGERLALEAARAHGIEVAILRTCLIYGPGRSSGSDILRHWAGRRVHALWDGGKARVSMVYVTDLAEAVWLAATRPEAAGNVYNVSGGEPHAWHEVAEAITRATGGAPRLLRLPGAGALPALRLAHRLLAPLAPRLAQRFDPRMVRFLLADHAVDIGRIRRELGYAPRVSLAEGVRRTLASPGQAP
jgi:nucleoside-diphosphate-sugar epimerase